MNLRRGIKAAAAKPCSECPWRLSNQGKRHPGGWYTKANLRRLWAAMRVGGRMTCHPTDPTNPLPPGFEPPVEGKTVECAGALTLQQREVVHFQEICSADEKLGAIARYRKQYKAGMTRQGLITLIERQMFDGTPFGGKAKMTLPNLNDKEIGYGPLTWHFPEPKKEVL